MCFDNNARGNYFYSGSTCSALQYIQPDRKTKRSINQFISFINIYDIPGKVKFNPNKCDVSEKFG